MEKDGDQTNTCLCLNNNKRRVTLCYRHQVPGPDRPPTGRGGRSPTEAVRGLLRFCPEEPVLLSGHACQVSVRL